jgi:hypothetical protein
MEDELKRAVLAQPAPSSEDRFHAVTARFKRPNSRVAFGSMAPIVAIVTYDSSMRRIS